MHSIFSHVLLNAALISVSVGHMQLSGIMKHAHVADRRSDAQRYIGSAIHKASAAPTVEVDWSDIIGISNSSSTCQVVSNAILAREYPPSRLSFQRLRELTAIGMKHTRYVPWFPLPQYGVPELSPGVWNTSRAAGMLQDLWEATGGNKSDAATVINFSTQPVWLYSDVSNYSVSSNPLQSDFGYPKGKVLADPTGKAMGEYFANVVEWIRQGEHDGPKYGMDNWEFLNEPDACRGQTSKEYILYFDQFVSAVRRGLAPGGEDLTYTGLALAYPKLDWLTDYLTEANHLPGTFDAV